MVPPMQNTWDQIKATLEKSLSPGLYHLWIKPLSAKILDGAILELTAPNAFVASWVRERLLDEVAEAASAIMNTRPKVVVVSGPKTAATLVPKVKERTVELALPGQCALPVTNQGKFRFNFDEFVVGPCNEMAYAASKGMCDGLMDAGQLLLSSDPGLGKTHLIQAMGAMFSNPTEKRPMRVTYLTAEEFSNRLIMAIKAREVEQFKAMFRQNVDVLLLEDIHFFKDKPKIQEELLNTLKALRGRGCKMVFTSSFLPRELAGLDGQLLSRFCSGFLASIAKPDLETRRRIVKRKAAIHQVLLPEAVSNLLAERLSTDIRQLESCIQNLAFKARLLHQAVSIDMAWQALEQYKLDNPSLGMEDIERYVCETYGLRSDNLRSKSRKRQHVLARNTAFFLARKHTGLSLEEIGRRFNRRHSTVIKGITALERHMSLQTPLGREIEQTVSRLSS